MAGDSANPLLNQISATQTIQQPSSADVTAQLQALSLANSPSIAASDLASPAAGAPAAGTSMKGIISSISNVASGFVSSNTKSLLGSLASFGDPAQKRLTIAGLTSSVRSLKTSPSITWLQSSAAGGQAGPPNPNNVSNAAVTDWRVKVSVEGPVLYNLASSDNMPGGNQFLTAIANTNGVIFPITPLIQVTHTAKYSQVSPTHSNYAIHFYEGSEVGQIQITAEFPVQNIAEGQYLLAVLYFFRAATKMYWGDDDYAGTPPPLVYLSGYGTYYFPNIPCVITQFMHTMPDDKDYIEVPAPTGSFAPGTTRLPTQSQVQVTLQPVYSRAAVSNFNLEDFANGSMLNGGGFI
jgi:hypothetical protein